MTTMQAPGDYPKSVADNKPSTGHPRSDHWSPRRRIASLLAIVFTSWIPIVALAFELRR